MRLRLFGLCGMCWLLLALAGCGQPGAPLPPSLNLPRPVEDLTASRRGNKVELEWTMPRKNTDRTNIKYNPTMYLCRHLGTALMAKCDIVAEIAPPTPKPAVQQKGHGAPGDVHIHYADTLPVALTLEHPAGFVTYAIEAVNSLGRSAGLSNQVAVPLVPVIPAPDKLTAQISAEGVRISWSGPEPAKPPTGVTYRYRIMRRPVGAPAYIVLDDLDPSAPGSYLDKTFAWEQKYEYRITTVGEISEEGRIAAVEGEDSPPVEIFTRDIYPPAQPVGLQAVFSSVGQKPFIDLAWAPNLESDLAGYNVYRWLKSEKPEKLNPQLVLTPSYRDEKVEPGHTYFYAVSAVDLRGNESPLSTPTSESVP